ncbi:MAG: hypothetical protein P1U58_03650 [Verrucomicrobiales bacterium]|nr:hypothetical protein [Verrucomicrobiales bacterium]
MNKRSPRFPFVLLEEAVELLRKLDAYQSDRSATLKRPEILKALDYASLHGAAVKTIGAMRAYDLLEKSGDGLRISPVGAAILDASSDEERRPNLQKAALSPLTFRNLWRTARHMKRSELIELLLSRGFTEQGAKRASRIYRKNDELASLQTLELEPELPERAPAKKKMAAARKRARIQNANAQPNMLRLPLSTGVAVIPKGISREEFKLLMETLRAWRGQLIEESPAAKKKAAKKKAARKRAAQG